MSIILGMSQETFFFVIGLLFIILLVTERFHARRNKVDVVPPSPPRRSPRNRFRAPSDPKRLE